MSNASHQNAAFASNETRGLTKLEYAAIHIASGHAAINDERTFRGAPTDKDAIEAWRKSLREGDAKYCVDMAEAVLSECEKRSKT